jgi:inosine/xanthosine triphosphatase
VTPPSPLARIASVRVGSLNAPKLEAVRQALAPYAPKARVEGVGVPSGVSEQPIGYDEIVAGARNRARRAFEASVSDRGDVCDLAGVCDLAIGIEDGLIDLGLADYPRTVLNVGCAYVVDAERESIGFSSAFAYPPECITPALDERAPIGDVFDRVFGEYVREHTDGGLGDLPSGRSLGNIGKLSLGVLPRSDYARQAVLCALVRFLHPALYDRECE